MDVKKEVFSKLDAVAKPGAILATNTSTLDVDEIAAAPAPAGRDRHALLQPGERHEAAGGGARQADRQGRARHRRWSSASASRRLPVVSGVCDGFIGNRMLERTCRRAGFLLEEGASPQQIDAALADSACDGPVRVCDLAGIDIGWAIRKRRYAGAAGLALLEGRRPASASSAGSARRPARGWYRYEAGNRKPMPDPEVDEMIADVPQGTASSRAQFSRRGNRRALHLRAGQRRRAHPRGRHRAARRRHRHGLPLRLRLPAVPRRADVLRRHGGPGQGARRDPEFSGYQGA